MKVFKFGGASIKSASAVKNMCAIIRSFSDERLVVVVSAMGKSTNALEALLNEPEKRDENLDSFHHYHKTIIEELFTDAKPVLKQLIEWISQLKKALQLDAEYDKKYDQVISIGEFISSTIISEYLNSIGCGTTWLDARTLIQTDNAYKAAHINWEVSSKQVHKHILPVLNKGKIAFTQGFIGRSEEGLTTTLGREGSDFTAAILATCLSAESVTVWKDVQGILSADPKRIPNPVLFPELSYNEAAEMTYYGASVIHPKTIKPLANAHIPLFVKCFDDPSAAGTIIHECDMHELPPCIIIKDNQCLISFKVRDFTFVNEQNLSQIFHALHTHNISINIMQNSAISFSVVTDYHPTHIDEMMTALRSDFEILYNTGLRLITVKNYTHEKYEEYNKSENILLEQVSRNNYRLLVAP